MAAALAATLASGAASAENFDFSYTFSSGDVISGSFQGTWNSTHTAALNITDVTASLDYVPFLADANTGYLDVTAWNTTTGTWDDTIAPVISTNAANNNFVFADTDVAVNTAASNYFFFINDATQGQQAFAVNTNVLDINGNAQSAFDAPAAGSWSLTAVPLPTTLPMMLSGLGLLVAAARRRLQA